ncbi:MAG: cellulose synthase/poly-beta-1,6-N-acetylglucosamine synthase-like glycosyltransferase, partial [Acidimicrobiales bacterium]
MSGGVPIPALKDGYSRATVVDTSTPPSTRRKASSADGPDAPLAGYPLVTVCVVAHNPGAWFDEVLRSLLAQDYPSLDVVVVDAASE